ncbi:EAL domain-containing protein [Thiomicrorhabdus sp. ZW0627]|uniref:putative bifunctional diguanylate cyclase/phosphodiesterase n=1 Tax=Thiomicrorhabdus sp. ZW0627 TaxID=3039774 RepID=UPI00243736B0|nr:EAL domain-containing protein [Thiomicrorhabdus sp. ZW0627]MDG6774550.1 EAL domain-containing protein [Thiomicrorhabdus sp. ZW0627]
MKSPNHSTEITKLIAELNHAHNFQRQQIADSFQEGLILFSTELTPKLVNDKIQKLLYGNNEADSPFTNLKLYTKKRNSVRFDLKHWIESCIQKPSNSVCEQMVWLKPKQKDDHDNALIPVQLRAYPIINRERTLDGVLLHIKDLTLEVQAEAQLRLMEASYAGQFITNSHGYITQPNYAFSAYTGLKPDTLKTMTYLDWLTKQVTLSVPFGSVMEALINEGSWSGEVKITASTDAQFYAVLSLTMLTDENRNVEHFIGVLQDITDIHEARSEIERLAYYDKLTGLANRTLLHNHIESTIQNAPESLSYSALILLDLDGFKILNDTLGHAIGDQLLILVAQKLTKLAGERNLVARLDGDEYAILIPELSQDPQIAYEGVLELASKVQEELDDRYTIKNRSLHCSASVGVYMFPHHLECGQTDQLIGYANLAMHEAKNLGGNQVFVFEDKLCEVAKQRLEMLQALNHSELDEEFQLYFQAQVDANGRAVAAETLLRWFHPTLGFVPPCDFIPVAEEGRQIIKIGLWVMHKAFLQAKAWNEMYDDIRVSINISPIQFHEQSFVELVIGLVKFTQVNPRNITLELTEGVLIRNTNLALQKIQHLVSLGFHISIDDFGTGYSSLSYLQRLPLHELKIDQSFIRHIPENPEDVAIVDSILKLAETKNLSVVAEGVESEEQAEFLRQRSKNLLIQGYVYSRPVPGAEFESTFLVPHKTSEKPD